ncbi:hypothetical protein [Chryseobacterium sp. C3]|uniref:hypothetical protein n=1 Tax=Chryseobacterium sp. C3 TaxID=2761532 RepID=UPI00162980AC|nr:hypothetical protein [Chryseobacterium sp. C3]
MKKLLLTGVLGLGLLLPTTISASAHHSNSKATTEFFSKKIKKSKAKKSRKTRRSKTRSSRTYSQSKGCTYNGNQLFVGSRGGCYYYSGNSKEYVDRSYCSGCN